MNHIINIFSYDEKIVITIAFYYFFNLRLTITYI
jgi:hypothetical protein